MFANDARVLLILSQDVLDQARVVAGRATAMLKLPGSLQIVLRALIVEGSSGMATRPSSRTLSARPRRCASSGVWRVREGAELMSGRGRRRMSKWVGITVLAGAVAAMALGCGRPSSGTTAGIEEKTYIVTPASLTVTAGIITGEVTEMKVTERVQKGFDRVVSAAKLTGTLRLKNTSANQTVRLVASSIQYIDAHGQPIKLEAWTEPIFTFATYGSERLDPGQETTQFLHVDFPVDALKAKRLKQIRLEFESRHPYLEKTVNLIVSIDGEWPQRAARAGQDGLDRRGARWGAVADEIMNTPSNEDYEKANTK